MTAFSDDAGRQVYFTLVDAPLVSYNLPRDIWDASLEVWVNGTLRVPFLDYWVLGHKTLGFAETLLPGDTLRVCAVPAS